MECCGVEGASGESSVIGEGRRGNTGCGGDVVADA